MRSGHPVNKISLQVPDSNGRRFTFHNNIQAIFDGGYYCTLITTPKLRCKIVFGRLIPAQAFRSACRNHDVEVGKLLLLIATEIMTAGKEVGRIFEYRLLLPGILSCIKSSKKKHSESHVSTGRFRDSIHGHITTVRN